MSYDDYNDVWDGFAKVPRDRWGRPMIVPPGGGKPTAYTRATTLASTVEDLYNLHQWEKRMVAIGLAERPDLVLGAAAHRDDRDELNGICDSALDAAKAHAAAGIGTALHKLCERLDQGLDIGVVPEAYRADIAAYQEATAALKVIHIEKLVVIDDLKVAGTPDRVVELAGRRYIADLKTGTIGYSGGKIATQLAIYSRGVLYDHTDASRELLDVDQERALVIHLPAGQGVCELKWVNLAAGWNGVELAGTVRRWRRRKDFYSPYDPTDAAVDLLSYELGAEVIPLSQQVTEAPSLKALEELWRANQDEWTEALTVVARQRKQYLHQRSLRTVGRNKETTQTDPI